jgi:serine/threonine protein kinase
MFVINCFFTIFNLDKIESFVGSGSYGDVFAVTDERDEVKAMKAMRLGERGTEGFKKRKKAMNSELDVGIELGISNEFLVQTTEFFMKNNYYCLIMEYCSHGDLQKIFDEKGQLPQSVSIFNYYYFNINYFLK